MFCVRSVVSLFFFFLSSRRRHTRCALVTGVQTCALPILADMIRELRAYDPKPGLKYGSDISQAIVPDLFVMERAGGWSIEINNATLPRLLVNRSYYVELTGGQHDRNSKAWLAECLASANWLIKDRKSTRLNSSH